MQSWAMAVIEKQVCRLQSRNVTLEPRRVRCR